MGANQVFPKAAMAKQFMTASVVIPNKKKRKRSHVRKFFAPIGVDVARLAMARGFWSVDHPILDIGFRSRGCLMRVVPNYERRVQNSTPHPFPGSRRSPRSRPHRAGLLFLFMPRCCSPNPNTKFAELCSVLLQRVR